MSRRKISLTMRLTTDEHALIIAASILERDSLNNFVRGIVIDAAELRVLGRSDVAIPVVEWEKFEAWAGAEPRVSSVLQHVAETPPVWKS
jgi:uncharacterized protein (DUF1778 family)